MLSPLAQYVQSMLNNGYSEQQVRAYLVQSGYQQVPIENAFTELRPALAPAGTNFWVFGAILGVGLGGVLMVWLLASSGTALSIIAEPAFIEIRAGTTLDIKETVRGEGNVVLRHDIAGTDLETLEKTIDVAGTTKTTSSLKLPATMIPGVYTVQVSAEDENGKTASTKFSLRVTTARASCFDGAQNQGESGIDCGGSCASCSSVPPTLPPETETPSCVGGCDDYDPLTDDSCVNGQCVHTEKKGCGDGLCSGGETSRTCPSDCGSGSLSFSPDDVIEDARRASSTDSDRGQALCTSLPRSQDKDRCNSVVAASSGKSEVCAGIGDDITRDQCYIEFALNRNEFDVCEKITNRYMRGSCNSLRNLRQLEQARVETPVMEDLPEQPTYVPPTNFDCSAERPTTCDDPTVFVCGSDGRTYASVCLACRNTEVQSYTIGQC